MNTLTHRLTAGANLLATLIFLAFATATNPAAAQPAASLSERHAAAVRLFREGRYAGAYGRFAELADAGHLPSAQLVLAMYSQGNELFGSRWSATPDQRRRWNALIINAARQRIELPDTGDKGD